MYIIRRYFATIVKVQASQVLRLPVFIIDTLATQDVRSGNRGNSYIYVLFQNGRSKGCSSHITRGSFVSALSESMKSIQKLSLWWENTYCVNANWCKKSCFCRNLAESFISWVYMKIKMKKKCTSGNVGWNIEKYFRLWSNGTVKLMFLVVTDLAIRCSSKYTSRLVYPASQTVWYQSRRKIHCLQ